MRRRNLLEPSELPTKMVTGPTLAFVTARETLERAVELADIPAFRAAQRAARLAGRYPGFGLATFIEASPGPPDYSAALGGRRVAPQRPVGRGPAGARRRRHRLHEPAAPRAGSRDDPRTARRRRARGRASTACGSCTATPTSPRSTSSAPGGAVPRPSRAARSSARSRRCASGSSTRMPRERRGRRCRRRDRRRSGAGARRAGVLRRPGRRRAHGSGPVGDPRLRDPRRRMVAGDALLLGRGRRRDRHRAHRRATSSSRTAAR